MAADFIKAYYKDAADKFMEYFQLISYTPFGKTGTVFMLIIQVRDPENFNQYWTKDFLDRLNNLFEEMMLSIDYLKTEDVIHMKTEVQDK